jgi:hypothetical protein
MRKTLLLTLAIVAPIAAARAADAGNICKPGNLCVIDAHGTEIGQPISPEWVVRIYKAVPYYFPLSNFGTQAGYFFYQSQNCSGTAYLPTNNVLMGTAAFDQNKVLWGVDPRSEETAGNFNSYGVPGNCFTYVLQNYSAAPVKILDATTPSTWVPPFYTTLK